MTFQPMGEDFLITKDNKIWGWGIKSLLFIRTKTGFLFWSNCRFYKRAIYQVIVSFNSVIMGIEGGQVSGLTVAIKKK